MNNFKIKIPTKKISTYLRDFSIVVAGIAVTLWIQSWLVSRNEQKDMELYLDGLKSELEYNCTLLDSALIPAMETTMQYVNYITTHDKSQLNRDTIQRYENVYYNIRNFSFLTSAFEMFKISGNMRFIADKKMLFNIWQIYSDMSDFQAWISKYYQDKYEAYKKDVQLKSKGMPVDIPMYDFYRITGVEDGIEYNIIHNGKLYSKAFKKIISSIEQMQKE